MTKLPRVVCDCNGSKVAGTFTTSGEWLILHSPLGTHRVRLGMASPRKLAAKLLKNLCTKAAAAETDKAPSAPDLSDRARLQIDAQRDKIVEMAADDPMRPSEERMLDQMIEASRAVEVADVLLKPPSETEETSVPALPPSGPRS